MANSKNSILKKDFHFRYDLIFTFLLTTIAPFCVFIHFSPLGNFWQNFISATAILTCSIIILGKGYLTNKTLPISPLASVLIGFFAILMLVTLLQTTSTANRLIFACCAGTAILTILLASQLAAKDKMQYYKHLALFIVLGGIIESIGAIAIQYRLWGIDYWMTPMGNRLFGFIAQSNHFAVYIMVAFLALAYLTLSALNQTTCSTNATNTSNNTPKIINWLSIACLVIISMLFGFTLLGSGSRTVILYLTAIIILTIFCFCISKDRRLFALLPGFAGLAIGALIFFFLPTVIQWLYPESLPIAESTAGAFVRSNASDSFRLSEIYKALTLFTESPLLGVGVGNYAAKAFWFNVEHPEFVTLGELTLHSHNFIAQIIAEFGIPGILSIFILLAYIIICFWKAPKDILWWFNACVLCTFFIIAMLEYILWRLEFLVLLLLILTPSLTIQRNIALPRPISAIFILALISIFYVTVPSSLRTYARSFFYSQEAITTYPKDYQIFREATKDPLWGRYVTMQEFMNQEVNFNELAYLEQITNDALEWHPATPILIKKLQLAVFTNNTMNLSKITKAMQRMYPNSVPQLCQYFSNDMNLPNPQALRIVRKDFNCRALSQ